MNLKGTVTFIWIFTIWKEHFVCSSDLFRTKLYCAGYNTFTHLIHSINFRFWMDQNILRRFSHTRNEYAWALKIVIHWIIFEFDRRLGHWHQNDNHTLLQLFRSIQYIFHELTNRRVWIFWSLGIPEILCQFMTRLFCSIRDWAQSINLKVPLIAEDYLHWQHSRILYLCRMKHVDNSNACWNCMEDHCNNQLVVP